MATIKRVSEDPNLDDYLEEGEVMRSDNVLPGVFFTTAIIVAVVLVAVPLTWCLWG